MFIFKHYPKVQELLNLLGVSGNDYVSVHTINRFLIEQKCSALLFSFGCILPKNDLFSHEKPSSQTFVYLMQGLQIDLHN